MKFIKMFSAAKENFAQKKTVGAVAGVQNILASLPEDLGQECFDVLLLGRTIRIERIVSKGHASPAEGWYDQEENEWVVVLQGAGTIVFEDGSAATLKPGDYLCLPAHAKHRVSWTDPEKPTVWLAVHYKD